MVYFCRRRKAGEAGFTVRWNRTPLAIWIASKNVGAYAIPSSR